jgi:hypothetical protein
MRISGSGKHVAELESAAERTGIDTLGEGGFIERNVRAGLPGLDLHTADVVHLFDVYAILLRLGDRDHLLVVHARLDLGLHIRRLLRRIERQRPVPYKTAAAAPANKINPKRAFIVSLAFGWVATRADDRPI